MSARDEILGRLRQAHRPAAKPDPWQSRRDFANLATRFGEALTHAHGEFHRAADLLAALQSLDAIFSEVGAQRVVVNAEPPLSEVTLATRWPHVSWHVVGQSEGDLRAFCATADVGLSSATAALAETGSVIVASGAGGSRLATLLPPVHVALVPASRLTSDIFTWTAARDGRFPANVTLISGPSKTADIEQTMAIGVHGPKRFIVVVYEDRSTE